MAVALIRWAYPLTAAKYSNNALGVRNSRRVQRSACATRRVEFYTRRGILDALFSFSFSFFPPLSLRLRKIAARSRAEIPAANAASGTRNVHPDTSRGVNPPAENNQ
jgi:hypothetical protein